MFPHSKNQLPQVIRKFEIDHIYVLSEEKPYVYCKYLGYVIPRNRRQVKKLLQRQRQWGNGDLIPADAGASSPSKNNAYHIFETCRPGWNTTYLFSEKYIADTSLFATCKYYVQDTI